MKEHTLHGCKICSSKEEYSCLIQPTKPSSVVKKTPSGPRNASRKQVIVDKTKEIINDLNIQYSRNYNMSFEKAYSKYIKPTFTWQRSGRNWISFEMFVMILKPNGKRALSKGLCDIFPHSLFTVHQRLCRFT